MVYLDGHEVEREDVINWLGQLKLATKGRFYDLSDGKQREALADDMLEDFESLSMFIEAQKGAA